MDVAEFEALIEREVTCACGITFVTTNPYRKKCKKNCSRPSSNKNSARKAKREAGEQYTFVGVDGEGVDRPDGSHEYILLSVGDRSLYHDDGSSLNILEIFEFLYAQYEPRNVYVGYFLGYDFSMWLKHLPEERARMLFTEDGIAKRKPKSKDRSPIPFPVRWEGWEFDILGMRKFKLKPEGSKEWMTICDVGSFFQMAFLGAINPETWPTPIVSAAEYATIQRGKSERDQTVEYGTPVSPDMITYNLLENEVLGRLMFETHKGLVSSGVRLKKTQFIGPGQAAQVWLNNIVAPKGEDIREWVPTDVMRAAQASYYGGWFEIMAHGHVPGITHEYDINSAYPYIISNLPCLRHGRWEHRIPEHGEIGLVYATYTTQGPIGPVPHRTAKGTVLRPRNSRGWHWRREIDASCVALGTELKDIADGWTYAQCDCISPFSTIESLYQRRIDVGKASPQGRGLKLIYNSAYGKQAQSIGDPVYGNAIYASLITSGCRSMILDAIATHPVGANDVLMVATDGVYFATPHDSLPLDKERLGAWDYETKSNLTLFKPGVYWDDKSRDRIKAGAKTLGIKSRGVNQRALANEIERIDVLFSERKSFPSVSLTVPFSVASPKLALHRGKWSECGKVTHDVVVQQNAHPGNKRDPFSIDWRRKVLRSQPYIFSTALETVPYDKTFGAELEVELLEADHLTPEGSYAMLVSNELTNG
jgi:hypothetical protein